MKTLIILALFATVTALACLIGQEDAPRSTPTVLWWMNDTARKEQAKWDAEHKDGKSNDFGLQFGRPPLIRFNIDGHEYELGARSDGVVVWRPFKP